MKDFFKDLKSRNNLLFKAGNWFAIIAVILMVIAPFNTIQVLGVNAIIKPIKFAISISIYFYTLAYLLHYWEDKMLVKTYSIYAVIAMGYEQFAITIQAFRGKLSHFNVTELFGGILYSLMGLFIFTLTAFTGYMLYVFFKQKIYSSNNAQTLAIKLGMAIFILFSFLGGLMSGINSHNVGGEIGGPGLPFFNWSTLFGDLRIAHFLGMHALQIIPIFGFYISNKLNVSKNAERTIWTFSICYFLFVSAILIQALMGLPFVKI